jgi:hypothetical protein
MGIIRLFDETYSHAHASIAAAKRRSCDPLVGKNGGETATIDATQVQDSESVNVRLWH